MRYLIPTWLLAFLLAGTASAQQLRREGGDYVAEIRKTFTVQPGGTLHLDRVSGSVDVTASGQGRVEIVQTLRMDVSSEGEARRIVGRAEEGYGQAGNAVRVRGRDERRVQHSFRIQVPVSFDVDVETSGGAVSIAGLRGRVDLSTAGGNVTVRQVTGPVSASTAGGTLSLSGIEGDVDGTTAGGSVDVQNVGGMVEVNTAGGTVEVRDVRGDVEAGTAGGGVHVVKVTGRVTASTAGGDIRAEEVGRGATLSTSGGEVVVRAVGGPVRATTSGGDVEGSGLRAGVEVSTAAGDIRLSRVSGPIEAVTPVGDVVVEVVAGEGGRPGDIVLETAGGDIDLTLPAGFRATIEAEVERHSRFDRDGIQSDFPLNRASGRDDDDVLRRSGTINGGGARVELHASGGSIRLRKGGSR